MERPSLSRIGGEIKIMEVCGTHTHAICRYGIRSLIPQGVRLLSGPGCPVCVTPEGYIDAALELASDDRVIITTFGDMVRIPGRKGSLDDVRRRGKKVRIIYSPLQSLAIAKENRDKTVVLFGVGFETTAPLAAAAVLKAAGEGIDNFRLLSAYKLMPPILEWLLSEGTGEGTEREKRRRADISGFILPGHVSAVIGEMPYRFISERYSVPGVIAGFGEDELIAAIFRLIGMINGRDISIRNLYRAAVRAEGNLRAQSIMAEVFEKSDSNWRGIGTVEGSGLRIRKEYRDYDAEVLLERDLDYYMRSDSVPSSNTGRRMAGGGRGKRCLCDRVLMGAIEPPSCTLFGEECTPEHPAGPCMVSQEGSCRAYHRYLWKERSV